MAVSKRLRYEILRRDGHKCRYCGASAPDVPLRIDHVTPVALGGTDTADNLVTACEPCNSGKTSTTPDAPLVADVADDAIRWAAAMKQAAANLEAQDAPKRQYRDTFEQAWNGWTWEHDGKKKVFDLPENWRTSLERFRQAGLPVTVWPDIVEKTMTNKTVRTDNLFRYCCGIAWRMVGELQDAARAIVGTSPIRKTEPELGLIDQTILHVWEKAWTEEHEEAPAQEVRDEFRASLIAHRDRCKTDPARMISAAQMGVWFQGTTIDESIEALESDERSNVVMTWADAWRSSCGDWPDSSLYHGVLQQVEDIAGTGSVPARVGRAAVIAGSVLSTKLHHGLAADDLKKTGVGQWHEHAVDIWARAFSAAASRWPTDDERAALRSNLRRISQDGDFLILDAYAAVAAAGGYQDADPTTCLTRHLSVFEAATSPLSA